MTTLKTPSDQLSKLQFLNFIGYEPISENLANKLEVKCRNSHTFFRPYEKFTNGNILCKQCIDMIKIKNLYTWGFKPTPNSKDLSHNLEVECLAMGHVFKQAYGHFDNQGLRTCKQCDLKDRQQKVIDANLTCIGGSYYGVLKLSCNYCKHIFNRAYTDIRDGNISCPNCNSTYKVRFLNSINRTPISTNLGNDLICICENNHKIIRPYKAYVKGNIGCKQCKHDEQDKLVSGYDLEIYSENRAHGMQLICKKGHIFDRAMNNFMAGATVCPICYPYISASEVEVKKFLDEIGAYYIHSDWKTLTDGKELDFVLPNNNLAIEFNGIYWHSELQGKKQNYHLNKTKMCEEKGINLLHILEHEWNNPTKQEIWKSIIKSKLNMHNKIGARKCVLKQVDKLEERSFLEQNHLQGFVGSKIAIGLYYNNELINLMTFGKNRMSSSVEWELLRFASKLNTSVVGGASKLLKYFTNNYSSDLVSYSDKRYSQGNMYKQLGFKFSHNSPPNQFYFKNGGKVNILESRHKYMKHKLPDVLPIFDKRLTAWKNMVINNYNRIWDCGNGVWIYKNE
jgi:hypothetical protein